MSLKAKILAAKDRVIEKVEVPEWEATVNIAAITGNERDEFEAWCVRGQESKAPDRARGTRAKLVAMALVDDDGSRVFGDDEIDLLGAKSAQVIDRLFDVALRVSGLPGAKAVEEAKKN